MNFKALPIASLTAIADIELVKNNCHLLQVPSIPSNSNSCECELVRNPKQDKVGHKPVVATTRNRCRRT